MPRHGRVGFLHKFPRWRASFLGLINFFFAGSTLLRSVQTVYRSSTSRPERNDPLHSSCTTTDLPGHLEHVSPESRRRILYLMLRFWPGSSLAKSSLLDVVALVARVRLTKVVYLSVKQLNLPNKVVKRAG